MNNTPDTIQEWFEQNLLDYANDIADNSCNKGFPYVSYTNDCIHLYEQYADQIWEMLIAESDDCGFPNVMEMIASFSHESKGLFVNYDSIRTILVWAVIEILARQHSSDY